MNWLTLLGQLSDVLSGEGAKITLSLTGVLVGVCFGILSFLPKLIENPYKNGRAELDNQIDRRNKLFTSVIWQMKVTALLLLAGNILLWLAALIKQGSWENRSPNLVIILRAISLLGGTLTAGGLVLFFISIVRYPVRALTSWDRS